MCFMTIFFKCPFIFLNVLNRSLGYVNLILILIYKLNFIPNMFDEITIELYLNIFWVSNIIWSEVKKLLFLVWTHEYRQFKDIIKHHEILRIHCYIHTTFFSQIHEKDLHGPGVLCDCASGQSCKCILYGTYY